MFPSQVCLFHVYSRSNSTARSGDSDWPKPERHLAAVRSTGELESLPFLDVSAERTWPRRWLGKNTCLGLDSELHFANVVHDSYSCFLFTSCLSSPFTLLIPYLLPAHTLAALPHSRK